MAAGAMIVVGIAGVPFGLIAGVAFVPAPIGKAGRSLLLLMAGLLLGLWWYPALGRTALTVLTQLQQDSTARAQAEGCTRTTRAPLRLSAQR
ncbi:hypothetical protein A6A05_16350 [Magnetospirillum moscoviense]|uniref:Uncharacterized protein n=1 Tax=Magnetospirillum moscoviense TaxID=1437059 RepID=A0A178MBM8_9PROT|nr:hypothetical protein A6A05_16350 [Magnetospirillum moscoviense]